MDVLVDLKDVNDSGEWQDSQQWKQAKALLQDKYPKIVLDRLKDMLDDCRVSREMKWFCSRHQQDVSRRQLCPLGTDEEQKLMFRLQQYLGLQFVRTSSPEVKQVHTYLLESNAEVRRFVSLPVMLLPPIY